MQSTPYRLCAATFLQFCGKESQCAQQHVAVCAAAAFNCRTVLHIDVAARARTLAADKNTAMRAMLRCMRGLLRSTTENITEPRCLAAVVASGRPRRAPDVADRCGSQVEPLHCSGAQDRQSPGATAGATRVRLLLMLKMAVPYPAAGRNHEAHKLHIAAEAGTMACCATQHGGWARKAVGCREAPSQTLTWHKL